MQQLRLPSAIKISKNTLKIAYQNIIFAISVKVLILILSTFGLTSLWAAVFADVGVAFIAILNAMRALTFKN
jgi:Cd2+/Zn2+-exporting ATPase